MKMVLLNLVFLVLISFFSFATGSKETKKSSDPQYSIKIGYVQTEKDPLTQGLFRMADELKKKTNGKILVEVMHSGVLGDTHDVLRQAQTGMNIGLLVDAGRFADYVPEIIILDAPYLFNNFNEANKFVKSNLFIEWTKKVIPSGVRIVAWNYYQGPRHFWTQKEIKSIDDLKNLKIRTTTGPVWQATVTAFGAKPVALPWGELYMAIQQKVVDGAEAQVIGGYGIKLYEVTKYLTKTEHFHLLTGMAISEKWFQNLPMEYQTLFINEANQAGEYSSNIVLNKISEVEKEMITKGLIIKEIDLGPFKEAAEKVYENFKNFTSIRKEIRKIVDSL